MAWGEAEGGSILLGMVSLTGYATSPNRPCRPFMLETAQEAEVLEKTGGWGQPFLWQPAAGFGAAVSVTSLKGYFLGKLLLSSSNP